MTHELHEHHHDTAAGVGFLSGMTLAIAALVLAAVVAAVVLFAVQPWDEGSPGPANPQESEQPAGGGSGGSGDEAPAE